MRLWREKRTWVKANAESKLAQLSVEDIKSIAIIKHAAFGDLLCTRPFIYTLRQHFPNAKLTFSAISHYQRGIPEDLVDRVHIIPSSQEKKSFSYRLQANKALGHHNLLFDLTESSPSFVLSWLTPADLKVGFQHRGIHRWIYDVAILRAEYRFEAETFLEQLHILGLQYDLPLNYAMPVIPARREKAYMVYFPTCSTPDRVWPIERLTKLIAEMAELYPDHEHILLSGLADWEVKIADEMAQTLSHYTNVTKLAAGKDDAALIKGARVLVANDTGIRHLGIAVGTPTVGLLCLVTPFGYWPRFGKHEVVFESDGSMPSVERVKNAMIRILDTD